MKHPLVVAITGASGAIFAARLLQLLRVMGHEVHVTISGAGRAVLEQELGLRLNLGQVELSQLCLDRLLDQPQFSTPLLEYARREGQAWHFSKPAGGGGRLIYHHCDDFSAPIASGSFLTAGMIICPCSGSTLAAVSHAAGNNLIHRAADVHLKERRRLILMPREAPMSSLQLENLARISRAGAIVLPAMPGWYHGVSSLADLVDFVVARVLDQLNIPHRLMHRWGQEEVEDVSDV